MSDLREPGKCPHCGGESDGNVMYSCPLQAKCRQCGRHWEFGDGIRVMSEAEARRVRPGYPWPVEPPESLAEGLGAEKAGKGTGEPS